MNYAGRAKAMVMPQEAAQDGERLVTGMTVLSRAECNAAPNRGSRLDRPAFLQCPTAIRQRLCMARFAQPIGAYAIRQRRPL
jgi:hypothetical protein